MKNNTSERINSLHRQLRGRLDNQLNKLTTILNANYKRTKYDFNKADSLTIIYTNDNKTSISNFIIIADNHILKSTRQLALVREINNGGGKLEPLKKDATKFKIYKTSNDNIQDTFLELILNTDTANAFQSEIYSPVDLGDNSIIITAKRINGRYRIMDYYLHEYSFVAVP